MSEATDITIDGGESSVIGDAWTAALSGMGYVSWIAREFRYSGVPREDLEAEGRLGLFDAALRFDTSRGVQFITYASWWARRRMQTFVARHARVVRRPATRAPAGRFRDDVSLDDAVSAGSEQHWRDVLSDAGSVAPIDAVLAGEEAALIAALAGELPPIWRTILVRRFGLDGEPPMTLAAIGERLDLSRERVRQIEAKCLRRMRRRLETMETFPQAAVTAPPAK